MNEAQNRLAALLLEHGLSKDNLAKLLGVSVKTINLILLGSHISPRVENEVMRLYNKYKVAEWV